MINHLPAILIGGPSNAGKSVLFYSLTRALHERGVVHHAIRACPDGEGNWYQEIQRQLDPDSMRLIRVKNEWTPAFVNGICRDLERRHLPLLVDMGGEPRDWQVCILQHCTHSLLLLRPDKVKSAEMWRDLIKTTNLLPLAEITSKRHGLSTINEEMPTIRGVFTTLERGAMVRGPLFAALLERISALFSSYSLEELEQAKLNMSPVSCTINLVPLLRKLDPLAREWTPAMLPGLAAKLPQNVAIAVYGPGPNWLYGMLAAFTQEFYQFDPRVGWLSPPRIHIGSDSRQEDITIKTRVYPDSLRLSISLKTEYLDHLQAEQASFPFVPTHLGVIIDGKLPLWLVTALVRLYRNAGAPWIACYQPKLQGAVVLFSHTSEHIIGDIIPLTVFGRR